MLLPGVGINKVSIKKGSLERKDIWVGEEKEQKIMNLSSIC